ncbi:MAG: hypothetical protein IK143_07550 [Bacteroidales bacterium]|nr:hypothetical protein [Bacteroidales bacterium]
MDRIPDGFVPMLEEAVGQDNARTVLEALASAPSVSVRLNPSKLKELPFDGGERVPWSPYGFVLKERPVFTLDPLFHAGCYYVQDSSAMFVGEVFRRVLGSSVQGPGMTKGRSGVMSVLDLCAAPGGKTTDIAASLREACGDGFVVVANEVMKARLGALRTNVAMWGDDRVGVVSKDPGAFPKVPLFDIIVADVPCSGEGMFRKDEKAVEEWSERTVDFCAARQKRIVSDIWPALKPGGVFVYSTCTFNRRENDGNVRWIADELGAEVLDLGDVCGVFRTECGYALLPGLVPGEGQYAAALVKDGDFSGRARDVLKEVGAVSPVEALPDVPGVELPLEDALRYLHGDVLVLPDAPKGLLRMMYKGQALGLAKNVGTRCNNLYPKDRRIRMDINRK